MSLGGDVRINTVRYPLVRDPKTDELMWKRRGGQPIQKGSPDEEVTVEWTVGWPTGIGETVRVSEESSGYAYSVGIDATPFGFARLAPKFTSVTPTDAPVDSYTEFFTEAGLGNAEFTQGNDLTKDSTGSDTVPHGSTETPVGCIFIGQYNTAANEGNLIEGTLANIGFSDGTNDASVCFSVKQAATTSATQSTWSETYILHRESPGNDNLHRANVTSFDPTNINLNYDSASSARIFQFMTFAGSDVQAKVVYFATGTSTGEVSITDVGFESDTVIFLSGGQTAEGRSANARLSIGAFDSSGNQWAYGTDSASGVAVGDDRRTTTRQSNTHCLLSIDGLGVFDGEAAFQEINTSGFKINITDAFSSSIRVAALCLKGVQVKAGTVAKKTSSGSQVAEDPGFLNEAYMVVAGNNTAYDTSSITHALGMGFATGTSEVGAMASFDIDAADDTDTDREDNNDAALILQTRNGGDEIDNEATCGNIDMGTAGWLEWTRSDANANLIHYLAFAAAVVSDVHFFYCVNGSRSYKMSLATDTLTVEETVNFDTKGFGVGAVAGPPARFGASANAAQWRLPLGPTVEYHSLSAVAGSGSSDTWQESSNGSQATAATYALAFGVANDGQTIKLWRAFDENQLEADANALGTWAGSGWDIGPAGEVITNIKDNGTNLAIATQKNLYFADQTGSINRVTNFINEATGSGAGLRAVDGKDTVFFNHGGNLMFQSGTRFPPVGPDSAPNNTDIPNLTDEAIGGTHYEGDVYGAWQYDIYRVVDQSDSTTYSYIFARKFINGRWIQHTFDRVTGIVRGMKILPDNNGKLMLWRTGPGVLGYYRIGQDGSPDSKSNNIGYGQDSFTASITLPRTDFGLPTTKKTGRAMELVFDGFGAGLTGQLRVFKDDGATETVGATFSSSDEPFVVRYMDTTDTFYNLRPKIEIISSAYTPAASEQAGGSGADPRLIKLFITAQPNPDRAAVWDIQIDTRDSLSDSSEVEITAATMRTNLLTLEDAGTVVAYQDPDGNTGNCVVVNVSEHEVGEMEDGKMYYVFDVVLKEHVTS